MSRLLWMASDIQTQNEDACLGIHQLLPSTQCRASLSRVYFPVFKKRENLTAHYQGAEAISILGRLREANIQKLDGDNNGSAIPTGAVMTKLLTLSSYGLDIVLFQLEPRQHQSRISTDCGVRLINGKVAKSV
ncbi:predicted protein [Aspergillus nidulans FGSC A4]|uniref:Uncharacterized protein n=1 Tax=Emericella nidulans (strain FGSC A4 / ATCC 38163 / CBS 112.46 / NRRL 194 / M139) TaxID=227321 RepID=Q5BDG1_EMENI|nr:hypothetical protein [Aspergillus nidulans FGSC A4]EAA64549.1 predicted protein [Aspergillus nidulans FGSC A4]CBF84821.1 TPA: hypothetical protein ANIA_01419 [Aspergillus nidulans FGSC A4]|eukprot:XP_659023.1 predicted protein [Aspergillus nidulans FGSC A4]